MPKHVWTPEMDAVLREHYPAGGSKAVVAALTGRVRQNQVVGRAKLLGVATAHRHYFAEAKGWRPDEDRVLRDFFPTRGADGCGWMLPGRTRDAIQGRANDIGLRFRRTTIAEGVIRCDDRALREAMARLDDLTRARQAEQLGEQLREFRHE